MIFAHAWKLLARNPIIVLPGVVLAIVGSLIDAIGSSLLARSELTVTGTAATIAATQLFASIAIFVVSAALSLVQMMVVTGMAGGAWAHGSTSLRDGWSALAHRLPAAALAGALLLVLGFCAAALAPATFVLSIVLYALLFIYTMAAVVIGGHPPIKAIIESARLALANARPTVAVVGMIFVIALVAGGLGGLLGQRWPFGGWLVAGLLQQVIVAYATLVIAGEYLKLASDLHDPVS
ncbi:MAG TPA: hypothetical protein VNF68_09340 [Candidatus Baltobacteraceae bacterium]|nr:hypothetical protein [Candidatus Baltobacteraceae bacterium]